MKCANCNNDAFYIYSITLNSQVLYCNLHLPKFLEQAKKAGLLKTTESLKSAIEEGLKNIAVAPSETEPVTESEPETTTTPTSTKKTVKKTETKNAPNS